LTQAFPDPSDDVCVEHERQWRHDQQQLAHALDLIASDFFSQNEPGAFTLLHDTLLKNGDKDMHLADLTADVAGSGKFSSDWTIAQHAAEIWQAKPCPVS
jgi:glycogen phosphorylase